MADLTVRFLIDERNHGWLPWFRFFCYPTKYSSKFIYRTRNFCISSFYQFNF